MTTPQAEGLFGVSMPSGEEDQDTRSDHKTDEPGEADAPPAVLRPLIRGGVPLNLLQELPRTLRIESHCRLRPLPSPADLVAVLPFDERNNDSNDNNNINTNEVTPGFVASSPATGASPSSAKSEFLRAFMAPASEDRGDGLNGDPVPRQMTNVFGCIAYCLHQSAFHGAEYAALACRHYKVRDAKAKKTKLPLLKLLKFLSGPGVVRLGLSVDFLLVSADRAACAFITHFGAQTSDDDEAQPRGARMLVAMEVRGDGVVVLSDDGRNRGNITATADLIQNPTRLFSDASGAAFSESDIVFSPLGVDEAAVMALVQARMQQATAAEEARDMHEQSSVFSGERGADLATGVASSTAAAARNDALDVKRDDPNDGANSAGVRDFRRGSHVLTTGESFVKVDPAAGPFAGMRYPNLAMGDMGLGLIGATLNKRFALARIRLLLSVVLLLGVLGVCAAMLHLLPDAMSPCCTLNDRESRSAAKCITAVNNTNINDEVALECARDACQAGGRLLAILNVKLLWGSLLSAGRLLVIALVLAVIALTAALATNFFVARPVALRDAIPRFWIVAYVVHILASALTAAAAALLFLFYREERHFVDNCDVYGASSQAAALCRAHYDSCGIVMFSAFAADQHALLQYLAYALLAASAAAFLVGLLPPMPSQEVRDFMLPGAPDTMIFRTGPYAPDGASPEDVEDLQRDIRAQWRREKWRSVIGAASKPSDIFIGRPRQEGDASEGSAVSRFSVQGAKKMSIFHAAKLLRQGYGAQRTHMHRPDPTFAPEPRLTPSMRQLVDAVARRVEDRISRGDYPPPATDATVSDVLRLAIRNTGTPHATGLQHSPAPGTGANDDGVPADFESVLRGIDPDKMDQLVHADDFQQHVMDAIAGRIARHRVSRHPASASPPAAGGGGVFSATAVIPMAAPVFPPFMMAAPTPPLPAAGGPGQQNGKKTLGPSAFKGAVKFAMNNTKK